MVEAIVEMLFENYVVNRYAIPKLQKKFKINNDRWLLGKVALACVALTSVALISHKVKNN